MPDSENLLERASHFSFGENWSSYAELISEREIEAAKTGLLRLTGGELAGKRFLDIGSGSGIHSLAALRLGAAEVVAIDLDAQSVATTRKLLAKAAPGERWQAVERSVFALDPQEFGTFDVVYSWGVLHHTGDMYGALRAAAKMVAPHGSFIFALYRLTHCCGLWKREKRWHAKASPAAQRRAQAVYKLAFRAGLAVTGRNYSSYVQAYFNERGMDFTHDVHDWLGGWPYESISPSQTEQLMTELGFARVRSFAASKTPTGVFGSGCDEYVYAKA